MTKLIVPSFKNDSQVLEGHVGGYIYDGDRATYCPGLWLYIMQNYKLKSVVDVGCGRGFTVNHFLAHGYNAIGIDGSVNAISTSVSSDNVILHDYNNGPFLLDEVDLCWSCEFVEHVDEIYMQNYIDTFCCSKYLAMTYADVGQDGHHHVNCQPKEYWISKLKKADFIFLPSDTSKLREISKLDGVKYNPLYQDNHFMNRGLFFINKRFI